jgi:hypothetical protein
MMSSRARKRRRRRKIKRKRAKVMHYRFPPLFFHAKEIVG